MTTDVIALTERMPDTWTLMAGLMSGGPDVAMATHADGAMIQLCDAEGRPLASVEAPMLVRVPGEASRLLGARITGPVWWTEVRAATAAEGGAALAGTIATRLVARLGGRVWPPDAAAADAGSATVREVTATAAPAAAQPAVDVLTERAVVVIQDRPVVAMTAWLSEALRAAVAGDRAFQIVTPPGTRLTLPTRTVLSGLPNRWVVKDGGGGYYDGLSGAELRWQHGEFAPATPTGPAGAGGRAATRTATGSGTPSPSPTPTPTPSPTPVRAPAAAFTAVRPHGESQLALSFRTRLPADDDLLLGGGLEAAWRQLTAGPPAGWGTAEPAGQTWSRSALTAFVRGRAPAPTWLVAVGDGGGERAVLATLRVAVTTGGVEEEVTLAAGYAEGEEPPVEQLHELAAELVARHGLVSMLVQVRPGARADLSVPPSLEPAGVPVAFAVGREEVRTIGVSRARRPPLPIRPRQLGRLDEAGFYYPLPVGADRDTDGAVDGETEGAADADAVGGWAGLERLMSHLAAAQGVQQDAQDIADVPGTANGEGQGGRGSR